jgi:enoyl-CoA hydratase/carnithine racemase
MPEGLELDREGASLVATWERGDQNSFSAEMIDALIRAVIEASDDPSYRFVRLRARGPVFCLARDPSGSAPDEVRATATRIVRINETIATTPLIVFAEVHGDAAGFGCGLVGASDVAVASADAHFWFPEIKAGLAPAVVISWASQVLPRKRAFDMASTGEPIDAATAERIGLVTEVVQFDEVSRRVEERIAALEPLHPEGLRDVKRFFARTRTMDGPSAAAAAVDSLVVSALRLRPS